MLNQKTLAVVAAVLSLVGSSWAQDTTLPAQTAPVPSQAASEHPPVFDLKSYDLSRITWYASADLPPDSSVEAIRTRGTPTTPTVTLRSAAHGGTGILFCFVQLPDPLPPGSCGRITIGDIDGNDEAFFNGYRVGSTSGWGVAEFRPRMYSIDHRYLKPGVNVFALRMSGPGGRPTFGIKSKTLSFCLTPAMDPETLADTEEADKPSTPPATIDPVATMQAIIAADPEVSATLLQRKRAGFGRFGEFKHNGLPAVSEISPTRIAIHKGPAFDVTMGQVDKVEIARDANEPGIDSWHTLTRVTGISHNAPLVYTARQNLLYPGVIYTLEQGQVMQLRVRFPEKQGHVFPLTDAEASAVFGSKPAGLSLYGFVPDGPSQAPAILATSGMSVNVTQANAHIDVSLARSSDKQDARVYIFYPVGLYRVTLVDDPKSLTDLALAVRPGGDPVAVLRQWLRVGLYEPVGVDEYFAPVRGESAIRIFQATRYRAAAGVDLGGPLLIRPPQVDYASQALDYPVGSKPTSSTGVLAFSGDMHYCDPLLPATTGTVESTVGPDTVHLISYDLPVPLHRERAPVEMYGQGQLKSLINQYALSDLGSTTSLTAVDAIYKSRTQAYQALSYLTPDKRNQLRQNSLGTVIPALGGHFWNRKVEPLSGLDYWYTYFIQGPYFKQYDQDWGNGLALYGLSTYVKYTGNWQLPAENWEAVERIFSWFTVTDDWEWMRASNSAHGYGTGAGDCMNATYAAAVAYTKLARAADRTADFHYGLYTLARAALPALNRFAYNDFAASNGFKEENSMVLGFHEGKGFISGQLGGYPWNVTSNISGNGIQTENHDLYMTYAQDALRNYEQIFEKTFPQWMNGAFDYAMDTLYKGNSGYITLPHIYLRARLGGDSFATLVEYLEQAHKNNYLWWLAPPVLAEVATKKADDVVVLDWENGAFLGATVEEVPDDDDRRKLTVRLDNKSEDPNTVVIRLPARPHRFDINGGPVPLTDSLFENGELKLKLRRPGENVITVIYSER